MTRDESEQVHKELSRIDKELAFANAQGKFLSACKKRHFIEINYTKGVSPHRWDIVDFLERPDIILTRYDRYNSNGVRQSERIKEVNLDLTQQLYTRPTGPFWDLNVLYTTIFDMTTPCFLMIIRHIPPTKDCGWAHPYKYITKYLTDIKYIPKSWDVSGWTIHGSEYAAYVLSPKKYRKYMIEQHWRIKYKPWVWLILGSSFIGSIAGSILMKLLFGMKE